MSKRTLHEILAGAAASLVFTLAGLVPVAAGQKTLVMHPQNPVLDVGAGDSWDSKYIDPGSVVFRDGKFHMFYSALPQDRVPLRIGYASSDDGINWRRGGSNPVIDIESTGLKAYAVNANGAVVTHDGKWALYFSIVDPGKTWYGAIGRATADDPNGPWTADPAPVLQRGPDGAWDANKIGDANVIKIADGYVMYYTGFGDFQAGAFTEEHGNIGMATSADGVTWTKHDDPATTDKAWAKSDPVLSIDKSEGAWDSWNAVDPNVQRTGDRWTMIYRGNTFETSPGIGVATSADGIKWTRASKTPILRQNDAGGKIYFASYVHKGGRDLVYLEIGSSAGTKVMLATREGLTN